MNNYATHQEEFWAGDFGDAYSVRNVGEGWLAANTVLFSKVFSRTTNVNSILEFGPNIGLNLRAIRNLMPAAKMTGVEINKSAASRLREWGKADVVEGSVLIQSGLSADFVLSKGLLIHINPSSLADAYATLFHTSRRYLCIAEYYNPQPVAISYRGNAEKLFKRDFAGEMLDAYPQLRLIDYGFQYHRDVNFPQDDVNWFLMEKTS